MISFIANLFPFIYSKLYFIYKTITEKDKINLIVEKIKKPSVIVDIGANIGFYTTIFSEIDIQNTIYSFEPDKDNFKILQKNVNKIRNSRITLENLAVGNKNAKIKLYKSHLINVDHQTYDSGENRTFELVKCTKLDDYFPKNTKIDFIKIDTQGFDYFAILGCKRILQDNPKITILGELWPYGLTKSGVDTAKYLKFLKDLGFTIQIEDKQFDLNNPHCHQKKYYTDFFAFRK